MLLNPVVEFFDLALLTSDRLILASIYFNHLLKLKLEEGLLIWVA